jgi:hypothetical protein
MISRSERLVQAKLEKTYMTKEQRTYTACEDWDFEYTEIQLKKFRKMWNDGFHFEDIAKALGKTPKDIVALVMDQHYHGYIQPRQGGLFGRYLK